MNEPIENNYFNWLCTKVLERGNSNYADLLVILHKTEFVWVVPADRNRAQDGIELRTNFEREMRLGHDIEFENMPCSVLEMMVAFAKRASFQTYIPTKKWLWEFISNLKLDEFRRVSDQDIHLIDDILYSFIWRQYDSNGYGGMFPMCSPKKDQRKVEIWYQFAEYVHEHGLF